MALVEPGVDTEAGRVPLRICRDLAGSCDLVP